MNKKWTEEYYIIGVRPVKILVDKDGDERDCLVLSWKTGKFERDLDYLLKISYPHIEESNISVFDINKVDEDEFNTAVKRIKLKTKKKKRGLVWDRN